MSSIEAFIKRCVGEGAFPGAVWLAGRRGETLEEGAAGVLGRGLGAARLDSFYDIASLTKLFTALALMRQLDEGLLSLEDTVGFYLPEFRGSNKAEITLFELLSHTSPIPAMPSYYKECKNRADVLRTIRDGAVRGDNKTRVEYTCEGYMVLGEVISAIDGCGLDRVVQSRVTEPLGIDEAMFNPPQSLIERIAPTEDCPWRGRVLRGEVHDENAAVMGGVSGNAGIFASAGALSRIAKAMLGETANGSPFLRPKTAALMTQNYTPGMGQRRGLCWMLKCPGSAAGDFMPDCSFGHTGFTGTSIWIDPKSGLYGILLSNRVHPKRGNDMIFRVRRIFHNLLVRDFS